MTAQLVWILAPRLPARHEGGVTRSALAPQVTRRQKDVLAAYVSDR